MLGANMSVELRTYSSTFKIPILRVILGTRREVVFNLEKSSVLLEKTHSKNGEGEFWCLESHPPPKCEPRRATRHQGESEYEYLAGSADPKSLCLEYGTRTVATVCMNHFLIE